MVQYPPRLYQKHPYLIRMFEMWKLIKEVRTSLIESSAFNYLHVVDEWENPRDDSDLLVGV